MKFDLDNFNYEKFMHDEIRFDADFESGSLGSVEKEGKNWYQLTIRQDTWYRFCFRIQGCRDQEIIFDFACRDILSPGYEEGAGRWTYFDQNKNLKFAPIYVSYDGKNWEKTDCITKAETFYATFRFKYYFKEDEAYVSFQVPYTYSDMLNWLKKISDSPYVKIDVLGHTRNGVAQPGITLAKESPAKDMVLLVGREDADEPGGSFGVEGVVDYILNTRPDLLEKYTFKIVPMVGIEGVICGTTHSAGYGYSGHNWIQGKAPNEMENVKQALKEWVRDGYQLKMAGKLHGVPRLCYDKGIDDLIAFDIGMIQCLREGIADYFGGDWKPFNGRSSALDPVIRPEGYFERYIMDAYHINYVFGLHVLEDLPELSIEGGRAVMHGIARFLDTLK